jgi:hypothetical protein
MVPCLLAGLAGCFASYSQHYNFSFPNHQVLVLALPFSKDVSDRSSVTSSIKDDTR